MSKFISPRPMTLRMGKARNPLVAPSLMRQAGRHAAGNVRQTGRRELQEQIRELGSQPSERSP